ncbi:CMRF35-like molecule 8 [Salvelinus alpinus]|uniref:CMRF35-like molecule 8 n=1 Tax=Salvelinus alpinus TaxID=8036 RepID=UPI0039FD0E5A
MNVKGVVGGHVMFGCSFTLAANNNKYFCRGTCSDRDILVKTKGSKNVSQDRYSIEDKGDVFYVTIKNLMKTDSGTYWCGVDRSIKDSYQEVHLTVIVAPPTSTPSPVTSRPHVSTAPPTSTPSPVTSRPHVSTTLPNLSTTSPNTSTTFLASGDISDHSSSRAGLMVWTSVGLVVMVTVLGLVLLLFYRQRRGTRRTPPPPPVSSNTQPDPTGEVRDTKVDCVYVEIREADRQTDTLPVVISVVYSTVNSPTNSTTYPAGQPSTTYPAGQPSTTYPAGHATGVPHCDIYANASCHKDDINPSYSTADQPASLIYSSVDLPKDSRVCSRPATASGSQDDSIYSTAQLPKDTVESTRYPAVDLSKDTPEDTIYSTAQPPKIM